MCIVLLFNNGNVIKLPSYKNNNELVHFSISGLAIIQRNDLEQATLRQLYIVRKCQYEDKFVES